MTHRTIITATLTLAATFAVVAPATADEGCTIGDYQGAPIEICPVREPDPTNCYTGDYQGAPIEICLPTGEQLPEGATYRGEPVVYHVSKDYVAPVVESTPVVESAPVVAHQAPKVDPAPSPAPTLPGWLIELQAILVANGGW